MLEQLIIPFVHRTKSVHGIKQSVLYYSHQAKATLPSPLHNKIFLVEFDPKSQPLNH